MSAGINVRPMMPSDLDAVMGIEQETLSPWSREQIAEELRQNLGWQFVAEEKDTGRPVGYICGRLLHPEGEIFKIAVFQEMRHQGIGRTLLKAAERFLMQRGIRKCYLELRYSNMAARKLYENAGFVELSKRKSYYANPPEDAVIMTKNFDGGTIEEY